MCSPIPRAILLAAVVLSPVVSLGGTRRHDRTDDQHVVPDGYASVGLLLGKTHLCSGTLIESDWVLTAAHCLDRGKAGHYTFELGNESRAGIDKAVHPDWTGTVTSGSDIALLKLDAPFAMTPATRRTTPATLPAKIMSVGYGRSGDGLTGATGSAGINRAGYNLIEARGSAFGWSDTILLNDFDNPLDATDSAFSGSIEDLEFNVAPGDSGGAIFRVNASGDPLELLGVTSLGWASDGDVDSDYGDGGGFTDVGLFDSWITGVLSGSGSDGGDGGKGGGPPSGKGRPFRSIGVSAYPMTAPVPEPSSGMLTVAILLGILPASRQRHQRRRRNRQQRELD